MRPDRRNPLLTLRVLCRLCFVRCALIDTLPPWPALVKEDPSPTASKEVSHGLLHIRHILPDYVHGGAREHEIDLLERHVLGLGHEEDLIYLAKHCDPAVEAEGPTGARHGVLHSGKVVCDDERSEEEEGIRCSHTVAAEIGRVDLGGND